MELFTTDHSQKKPHVIVYQPISVQCYNVTGFLHEMQHGAEMA